MDAQNATNSDQTKPAGPSSEQHEQTKSSVPKSPKSSGPKVTPQSPTIESKPDSTFSNGAEDRDSDAETIVLPGKDGHSPSKARAVRQEDRSDNDGDTSKDNKSKRRPDDTRESNTGASRLDGGAGDYRKEKKRPSGSHDKERLGLSKDGSSGLSSAPTSPPRHQPRRRRSMNSSLSLSDSEERRPKPPLATTKSSLRDKFKSGERLLPPKRKAPRTDSDDDEDHRKARRPRTTSASLETSRGSKDNRPHPSKFQDTHHKRSTSPPHRMHRRSVSTQLPSQPSNGPPKKKRLPPPLHQTDYNSDESSASGSPYPQHTKLRNLTTPSTTESNLSPAKVPSHKKHLDAHGQTLLARACARGEYDSAKTRLRDRPEDLNVADYAGNTPLQIAAINGCEDIVKLLIDAGCNLDCVNYDKDTPLLDAVDNGHLGVVKLLLDAGVNPRKANVNGEEPIDRVTEDTDNADEIRAALVEAKKRFGGRTKTSEDRNSHGEGHEHRDPHAPDSPRQSSSTHASSRRAGTVRATKTRNDLLYMPLDDKTLRQAAGRGDEETVARVLQVKENCDDAESMVAAARGGHDLVIQLLLGLGGAKADPEPVSSQPEEFATPMLAAIGQENIKVVELLLEQQNFDPTRRFKGETYYEIAKRRQGTNWKEEEDKLKKAYDKFKSSHKTKTKSPGKKEREREREEKRARREERADSARPVKRSNPSPTGDGELRRKASSAKLSSPKERKKSDPHATSSEESRLKRGAGRSREEKMSTVISDREVSPSLSQKFAKTKRTESDLAAISSEGETMKPRRKLVSKGELRGERDKNRRSSMASNASSFKEPSSPHETRNEESGERQKLSEKYHDRAKALKRDESKDRPLTSADHNGKRHRASLTPDCLSNGEKEEGEKPAKRQRLEGENSEKRQKRRTSEEHLRKHASSTDGSKSSAEIKKDFERDPQKKEAHKPRIHDTIRIKSEDLDVEMINVDQGADHPDSREEGAEEKKTALAKKAKEDEAEKRRRAEAEEVKRRLAEAEVARKKMEVEEAEKRKKLEEQRQAEKKRQEEEERLRAEEEARQAAEEQARREAEEKRQLEEARRKQEEEERKKREAEEQKRRKEEEERLRKEREAAEEARRKREEEERLERERRERLEREELERKRVAMEAEQRRIREELDRARLDKLPPLLRWLDTCPNPKTGVLAEKFKTIQGARYDCINPETNQTLEGREQWVLNTHVALLLGEKDLGLPRYTTWERAPVSILAKKSLWRIEKGFYSLLSPKMLGLGQQLPGYYGIEDVNDLDVEMKQRLEEESWKRFRDLDMFFVKLSDFLSIVPTIPHLRNLRIAVTYRELLETEEQARRLQPMQKWKHDPDANRLGGIFAPRNKYYIDGSFMSEDKPERAETSNTPFPEPRVPRRGLLRVLRTDPDHDRICIEQGLGHLVKGKKSPSLPNGVHTPPASHSDAPTGASPSEMNEPRGHDSSHDISEAHSATNGGRVNGVNGTIL